jgi:hypothetical protein
MNDVDELFKDKKVVVILADTGTYQDNIIGVFFQSFGQLVDCRISAKDEPYCRIVSLLVQLFSSALRASSSFSGVSPGYFE